MRSVLVDPRQEGNDNERREDIGHTREKTALYQCFQHLISGVTGPTQEYAVEHHTQQPCSKNGKEHDEEEVDKALPALHSVGIQAEILQKLLDGAQQRLGYAARLVFYILQIFHTLTILVSLSDGVPGRTSRREEGVKNSSGSGTLRYNNFSLLKIRNIAILPLNPCKRSDTATAVDYILKS